MDLAFPRRSQHLLFLLCHLHTAWPAPDCHRSPGQHYCFTIYDFHISHQMSSCTSRRNPGACRIHYLHKGFRVCEWSRVTASHGDCRENVLVYTELGLGTGSGLPFCIQLLTCWVALDWFLNHTEPLIPGPKEGAIISQRLVIRIERVYTVLRTSYLVVEKIPLVAAVMLIIIIQQME